MIILKNLKAVLFKYIKTFQIANIEKKSYFFVIFLTMLTVIFDAAGISILLPIGEYVLNYQSRELPDTYAWKILKKVFLYLGLKPNIELVVGFAITVVTLRQSVVFIRAVAINKITFKAVKDFREKLFVKFLRQDLYYIKYYSTGVYNNIINEEVNKVGRAIVLPLENVSGIILIISYLCLMMFISIKATLIVMIFMLLN